MNARAGAPDKRCQQGHTGQYHGKQCVLSEKQPVKSQKKIKNLQLYRAEVYDRRDLGRHRHGAGDWSGTGGRIRAAGAAAPRGTAVGSFVLFIIIWGRMRMQPIKVLRCPKGVFRNPRGNRHAGSGSAAPARSDGVAFFHPAGLRILTTTCNLRQVCTNKYQVSCAPGYIANRSQLAALCDW